MNNKKVVYEQRGRYLMIPTDYINALLMSGQREKASSFSEYFIDMSQDEVNSVRFYAARWSVGKSAVSEWIKEFKEEIAKFHAYWSLKNDSHYSSVKNKNGQQTDKENIKNGQQNKTETDKTDNSEIKTDKENIKNGQQTDKDLNSNNKDNIYVESSDSDKNKSSSKNKITYTNTFEILWHEYDKKSGNKPKAFNIYQKKFKNVDIKLMIEAIKEYKETKEEWRDLKDFDGFLNGVIDIYLPKRAWLIDKFGNRHVGHFYDSKNLFISNEQLKRTLESSNITEYIADKRFGYIGA